MNFCARLCRLAVLSFSSEGERKGRDRGGGERERDGGEGGGEREKGERQRGRERERDGGEGGGERGREGESCFLATGANWML